MTRKRIGRDELEKLLGEYPQVDEFLRELFEVGLRLELGEPVESMFKSVPVKLSRAWKKRAIRWARFLVKGSFLLLGAEASGSGPNKPEG
jgi:hypothetical protein